MEAQSLLVEVRQGSLSGTAAALRNTVTINVAQERGVLTVLALQTPPSNVATGAAPVAAATDVASQMHVTRKAPLEAVYVKVFARTPAGVCFTSSFLLYFCMFVSFLMHV